MGNSLALITAVIFLSITYISNANQTNSNGSKIIANNLLLKRNASGSVMNMNAVSFIDSRCLTETVEPNFGCNAFQCSGRLQLMITNQCNSSIDLRYYYIGFNLKFSNGMTIGLANYPLLYPRVLYWNQNAPVTGVVNLSYANPSDPSDERVIGLFQNYVPLDGPWILAPGEAFAALSDEFVLPRNVNKCTVSSTYVGIQPSFRMLLKETNVLPYGRDGLTNIPIWAHGLKTLVVTNNSMNQINQIKFQANHPIDITYDKEFTTCSLSGHQVLNPGASCNIVFRYTPLFEGVSNSFSVYATGLDSSDQSQIITLAIAIPYSSRLTSKPQPGIQVGPNSRISGITLVRSNDMLPNPKINSFENITAGYSGLVEYTITNQSSIRLYGVTLPKLSGEFSYDPRTTCRLDNKLILSPSQSCYMVIRYTPKSAFPSHGVLPIQVAGVDVSNYVVYANAMISEPYSSRAK